MTLPDDTRPKPPPGLRDTSHLDETGPRQPVVIPPPPPPPPVIEEEEGGWMRWLVSLTVILLSSCMCLAIVSLSGFAGVQDEMRAIGTADLKTQVADVATQYSRGNEDYQAGRYELAEIRYEYVETTMPGYQDAAQRLEQVRTILEYTPTPSNTPVPSATVTPTVEVTQVVTTVDNIDGMTATPAPTSNQPDPAALFGQAQTAMSVYLYEEAIEWLEALILLAPNYRSEEVEQMLIQALTALGKTYLRGENTDGEDRLAQGVQMINRAADLGYSGEFVFEANFVSRFLTARAYLEGGLIADALPILTRLCEDNCDWGYHGQTIRQMLIDAGGTPF